MKELLEKLYPIDRYLLGSGYDKSLEIINQELPLEIIEIPSGTQLETWTVPDEWVIREAWVKFNGEKIIDYSKDPLAVVIGSLPFSGKVTREELKNHLHYSDDKPNATPFVFKYYDKDWGLCAPKNKVRAKIEEKCENGICVPELHDFDETVGKVQIEGQDYTPKWEDRLEEGEYEVFIDSEYKPGVMKIGVHTIKGKTDREILLFAHLDHPFQANDNLSGVVCLTELAKKISVNHTIKIVFCPETIGSMGYGVTQDLSKVDFVIAVDICGNNHTILLQKAFDSESRLNRVANCALQILGKQYRKGKFRNVIGSDEYFFNDPLVGIPGLMISRTPYPEYHTSEDTPDKIQYDKIEEVIEFILKIIEIYEKDYVPVRNWKGALMRSRYGLQSQSPQLNLNFDYLFYSIDGKKSLVELCSDYELNFDVMYDTFSKIEEDGKLCRLDSCEVGKQKTPKQKSVKDKREANVSDKRRKVS